MRTKEVTLKNVSPLPVIVFLALTLFINCAQVRRSVYGRPFEPVSAIGYKRILESQISQDIRSPGDGTLLWAYTEHIGPMIYSECQNAPSDSQNLKLMFRQQCSTPLAMMTAIGRMLREHDLPVISLHSPFVFQGHLVWADFPFSCKN